MLIWTMEKLGLATEVVRPNIGVPAEAAAKLAERARVESAKLKAATVESVEKIKQSTAEGAEILKAKTKNMNESELVNAKS
jgi:hypothetical protein